MQGKKGASYWMVVVAGCGLIGTCLGLGVNVAGLFFSSIAADFGVGRGSVAATLTVYNLVQAFTGMVAPAWVERVGLRRTVLAGTVVQVSTTFLLSVSTGIGMLMGLNALRGFASGLIGTVTVTIMVNYWFNERNALMTSICMGFSGLVSALLSPVLSSLIVTEGWRVGYRLLAALTVVFNLPALLLPIALRPEDRGMDSYGSKAPGSGEACKQKDKVSPRNASIALMVVLMAYTACCAAATALPQHFSGIADSYGMLETGALMVSACMVVNTAGKVLLGSLIDRIGPKASITLYAATIATAAVLIASVRSPLLLVCASALFGLCYSLATVGTAMLTREMFGLELYSSVYPKIALTTTISNAVFTTLVGALYDLSGTYNAIIIFLGGAVIVAYLMMQLAYRLRADV